MLPLSKRSHQSTSKVTTLQTNDYSSSNGVLITWIRPLFHSIMTAIETQQRQQPVRHQKMRDKAIKMGKNINRTQVMGTSSITMPFMFRSLTLLSKAWCTKPPHEAAVLPPRSRFPIKPVSDFKMRIFGRQARCFWEMQSKCNWRNTLIRKNGSKKLISFIKNGKYKKSF